MEKSSKHRILGALVVVGLVVITLPLFQNSDLPTEPKIVKAPPFPDQYVQVTSTAPTILPNQAVTPLTMPFVAEHTESPVTKDGPVTKQAYSLNNVAWVIQLGSFKNKANALRLVNELRASGYRAFIKQIPATFGQSTRVFVGPEKKRGN